MTHCCVKVFLMMLAVWIVPYASTAQTFVNLDITHSSSYDYQPSIMYDETANRWKAWWCGRDGVGDGIYYAESPDKILWAGDYDLPYWTPPQLVFTRGSAPWENKHVCDPTVIKNPSGVWSEWNYVMYYNGAGFNEGAATCVINQQTFQDKSACNNKIGVALSSDGKSWVRFSNPDFGGLAVVKDCGDPTDYGCGHFSVVNVQGDTFWGTQFLITYTNKANGNNAIHRLRSYDGYHFFDDVAWNLPSPLTGGGAIDVMYNPGHTWKWLAVITYNDFENLYGATDFGATWTALSWFPGASSSGSGFFRSELGFRPPDGHVWSAYGNPAFSYLVDWDQQELKGVNWGNGW